MFTEAEGAAFELSWELHIITILTSKTQGRCLPLPFSQTSICPHILPFLPRKEKAIVEHYKVDYYSQKWRSSWGNLSWQLSCSVSCSFCHICVGSISAHQGLHLGVPCTHEAQQPPLYTCHSPWDTTQLPTATKDSWLLFKINIKNLKLSHGLHSIVDD